MNILRNIRILKNSELCFFSYDNLMANPEAEIYRLAECLDVEVTTHEIKEIITSFDKSFIQ